MQNITNILKQIEQKKNIKILYACETGSRAWGFPSPDSDYDIRFLYMHEKDWYLGLNERKDTIEIMDGDLDITGWDLRKCLKLLKKSNVPLIERFQSPIVYFEAEKFKTDFKKLIGQYYSPIAIFYHHFSLAAKFWDDLKHNDEVKLKSLFYLIRSLLSCNFVVNSNEVLPMDIFGLMKYNDEVINAELNTLIKIKSGVGEKYLHPTNEKLNLWIAQMFDYLKLNKENIKANGNNMNMLNEYFIKTLYGANN